MKKIINFIKNLLGIKSPSKEMIKFFQGVPSVYDDIPDEFWESL